MRLRTLIPLVVVGIFLPIGMVIIGITYGESLSDLELRSRHDFGRILSELSLRLDRIGEDRQRSIGEAQGLLSSAGAVEGVVHLSLVGKDERIIASTRYEWIDKPIGEVWPDYDKAAFRQLFQGSRHEILHFAKDADFHAYHFTKLRAPAQQYIRTITQAALVGEYSYMKTKTTLEARLRQKSALYFFALLIAAVLISLLLIRMVSRPLERISGFMSAFDETAFGSQIALSGSPEMRALGVAVNHMSLALNNYDEQINAEIRERKHTEEMLQRFRAALDSAADSVYVIDPVAMRFIDMNRTAYESLLYSKEELLTMGPQDIKPLISKSELTRKFAEAASAAETLKFETVHRRKDGKTFPVELLLNTMQDQHQQPIVIASVRDITERKASEERLRKLSQAIEQTGEAVLITNADAVIEYVNPAFTTITGYKPEEAVGKTPAILKSSAQDPSFYKEMWETILRGDIWQGTMIDRRSDGSFYPAMMSVAPITSEQGLITHYVSIQQDMTEYKRLEAQFLQAQKMESIGTLVGGIAHDFNNMLAGITGNLYLARGKAGDNQSLIENIDAISALSDRAADMIKQLLAFARKGEVNVEPVVLNMLVREGVRLAGAGIPENIELSLDICPEELVVQGDWTQLQQIIMNICNNARDALADTPAPEISCSLERYIATPAFKRAHPNACGDAFALLTIRDNGAGIPAEHLEKIYEPFFTTKDVGKGTGLGLAMVYGSIQAQQGVLEVKSELGHGSSFHIYLPLSSAMASVESEPVQEVCGYGETILLADDEVCMREATGEVLRRMNYRVLEASDGEQALELFREHGDRIDLVLTDVVMPRLGGIDLARSIRTSNEHVPIIFATGYDRDDAVSGHAPVEHTHIISKPFSYEKLSQLIRELLAA